MNEASKKLSNLSPEAKRALLAQLLQERAKGNETREWLPISHNQKALWFLYRLAPQSAAYNLLYAARIRSNLDLGSLQRAIHTLAQRYPILTSTYSMHDGEPMQRLQQNRTVSLEVRDASNWSQDDLTRQLYEESNRPIDLEQGPIMRIQLYKCSAEDYILGFIAHHIAVDFWALDILVDELYILYVTEKANLSSPLPKPGPENAEYVQWQNTMLAGTEGKQHWAYWQQELSSELPVLNLPTDRPRPPVQTYKGASHSFALSDDIAKSLRLLASSEKVTLFTLMLAAYQTLLFRYTNQEDLIVGTTALGRSRADFERVIGYLANPVMVRAGVTGNPTFKELLAQTRRAIIDALEHQDFPFPLLVERLQPRRDPSYSPLYQTLFIWDRPRTRSNQDLAPLGLEELSQQIAQEDITLEPFVYGQQGAPFDLTLTIFESNGALTADFHYNIDLFEPATIARMEQHFQILLAGIVANPQQHLQELPLLTEQERHQILVEWNATQRAYPKEKCIHQLFEAQVERSPEAVAVVFEGEQMTYQELNRRANQLAHHLQHLGVGPEVLVGICVERSLDMIVGLLGILKAGGAYVPLDPGFPSERIAFMLEDAQAPVLVTQQYLPVPFPKKGTRIVCLDTDRAVLAQQSEANLLPSATSANLAYVIYTSGSTGYPKGVQIIHRAVVNFLLSMRELPGLRGEDTLLAVTTLSFDIAALELFLPLVVGARVIVVGRDVAINGAVLMKTLARTRTTLMQATPVTWRILLAAGWQGNRRLTILCGGEALPLELAQQLLPKAASLWNLYGPTETTIWSSVCQIGPSEEAISIGRPIANTQIYLLDAHLQPVPVGVPGELYIGGEGLARGYLKRPELTAERFIPHPFSDELGACLYKTGDLARYCSDGTIEHLGRLDHQVKIRGFRIELGEIEAELSQHLAIKDVVVVAREDTPGNKRLVAYLVANPDALHPNVEDLRTYLKEKLPSYMIPVVFMYLDAMPLNPNGKVDRKALPAPDRSRPDLETAYVPPSTPTEQRLVAIWTEGLGLDKVGIHDNYFDLGGASLQSLEIINKANEAGISLALEMLFEHQTIAELAAAADAQKATQVPQSTQVEELADKARQQVATAATPEVSEQPRDNSGNMLIESIGTYLPPKIVSSDEIVKSCIKPLRFPLARLTGINNRRMAGETEFGLDLSKKAIADCLANSKYNPQDIDLLICCSISRCNAAGPQFTFEPSTSIQLKRHFGFSNAITFDVSNACTTLFTGMYIAEAFLKTGMIRRAMVLSGEYISHLILTAQKEIEDFMDSRLACLTVGDAGAALILERSPDTQIGFHEFEMYTVGRYSE
ncbi:MAG TPA: amino acid adenylation domain-containing protein, partial [Ktedonobacteraceae bacterium]|nr:amino acid adenylation domain-containing protein [Ktedonobacteraceae bacterium]